MCEFHLEMILLPFIKKHLENSIINIITENNLMDTLKVVIERVNLDNESKEKILNLGWNNHKLIINKKNKKQNVVIINGSNKFIENINKKIKELNINCSEIIDCYNVGKYKMDFYEIKKLYKSTLNTEKIEK